MHLRWRLILSYLLVAAAAVGGAVVFSGGDTGLPAMIATGCLIGLLGGIIGARLLLKPMQKLRDDIRGLAASGPHEDCWSQRLEFHPAPDFALVLDDLRERTRQRLTQLTVEKSRLEGILESITEGIMVTGRDGRVVMANKALGQLFGNSSSFEGRMPVEVVRNNDVEEAISRSLTDEVAVSVEMSPRGGGECHLDVHIAPIEKDGECIGVVTVFYNITKLRQLERVRKDFVANVSHELRTPLTVIKGYAETLTDGALDDRQTAERFIQIITSQADRLNRLLDDILDLSRLEAENLAIKFESCELRGLVENCISSVTQPAARKQIAIELDIPHDLRVSCDCKLIEQAIINLLDNAVKYTPDGGSVQVFCAAAGKDGEESEGQSKAILRVKDTGIGIPHQDLERIFERFYRVDKGRSRAMGGTGLGLAIVRHILQAHGERVWVKSELGKGTTFAFSLRITRETV